MPFIAVDIPSALTDNAGWIVAGLIIVVGLFVIGIKDLLRFHPRRVWAISGVCFDESIRRRILWITPLAILGVIIVAQLQKPIDEQDAIRQTTKFCLFATGLVVTISTIILAASNLPREIENRVIYTVVTKPTTRLEIILGKIVGFARVSAAILIIMGLFTLGYLELRAHFLVSDIRQRLSDPNPDAVSAISRPTLEHYRDYGLLNAKSIATPASVNIYARVPALDSPRRYFSSDGLALVPFTLPQNTRALSEPDGKSTKGIGLGFRVRVGFDSATAPAPETPAELSTTRPFHGPTPLVASSQPTGRPAAPSGPPQLAVQFYDANQNYLVGGNDVNGGKSITLTSADGQWSDWIPISAQQVVQLAKQPFIYLTLVGATPNVQYWIDDQPAEIAVWTTDGEQPVQIGPIKPNGPHDPQVTFIGRQGTAGQQIKGAAEANQAAPCIYEYHGVDMGDTSSGAAIPVELRVGIERGSDDPADADAPTHVSVQVRNHRTGQVVDAGEIRPENNRPAYTTVPAAAFAGGDFDVILRCLTPGHWVGLTPISLSVVRSESPFALNLLKSLLIIWLLAVLVITISIFCSTFLSWPIAVVLTLVILLGRWGVQELGDAATAGLGRQFVTDFGVRDPASAQALSNTVEQLNKLLGVVAAVLPDITKFSATEDIERGISIARERMTDAIWVLIGFGIPLSVLAYVFLKNKEVAP
jgi:hypothetical protein